MLVLQVQEQTIKSALEMEKSLGSANSFSFSVGTPSACDRVKLRSDLQKLEYLLKQQHFLMRWQH